MEGEWMRKILPTYSETPLISTHNNKRCQGVLALPLGIWCAFWFLTWSCGQGKLNIVRHWEVCEISKKMMSLHVLSCKLLPLFAEHRIHGNIVLNFCLHLHTRAHTNNWSCLLLASSISSNVRGVPSAGQDELWFCHHSVVNDCDYYLSYFWQMLVPPRRCQVMPHPRLCLVLTSFWIVHWGTCA